MHPAKVAATAERMSVSRLQIHERSAEGGTTQLGRFGPPLGILGELGRTPPPSNGEERELQADHKAAPVLQRYLELADIALGVKRRPYRVSREDARVNHKRAT
jgi:hypothetical protein